MCEFIEDTHVMPGYICHACKTYNGLQRTNCRACGKPHCALTIPEHVGRCPDCGWGYIKGETVTGNMAGQQFEEGKCPCCSGALTVRLM